MRLAKTGPPIASPRTAGVTRRVIQFFRVSARDEESSHRCVRCRRGAAQVPFVAKTGPRELHGDPLMRQERTAAARTCPVRSKSALKSRFKSRRAGATCKFLAVGGSLSPFSRGLVTRVSAVIIVSSTRRLRPQGPPRPFVCRGSPEGHPSSPRERISSGWGADRSTISSIIAASTPPADLLLRLAPVPYFRSPRVSSARALSRLFAPRRAGS